MGKKFNPNRVGNALRPIIRESYSDDRAAAYEKGVHEAVGVGAVPQADPGQLITQPDLAGAQVKGQLGGGYFAPLKKTGKFK